MRIAFAADHAGADLKAELMARLAPLGYEMIDLGGDGSDRNDDYPDFAKALGLAVLDGRAERGILVCGSGVGAAIAASKIPGIRAGLCHDTYSAGQGVQHDDMNVLALGGRIIGIETAVACARAFLDARFSGDPRHRRRLDKVNAIEAEAASIRAARATNR
jgi:ribose 5-phosphate isomerase B